MNESKLIDEQTIVDALRPFRVEPDDFANEVEQRIASGQKTLDQSSNGESASTDEPYLQTAASVIPFPLLTKLFGGQVAQTAVYGANYSFSNLSLLSKAFACMALPAITLLFMLGVSFLALVRIFQAQRAQKAFGGKSPESQPDAELEMQLALTRWWRQFGGLVFALCAVIVVLIVLGYTLPVFLIFLASGIAMVSLVTRLGKSGLLTRRSVTSSLIPSLAILAQLTLIYTQSGSGIHLLDQALIQATLFCGAIILSLIAVFSAFDIKKGSLVAIVILVLGGSLTGWFSSSILFPISRSEVQDYVESFDNAPYREASWQLWTIPAQWLTDENTPLDLNEPKQLIATELSGEQSPFILASAFQTGLLQAADAEQIRELDEAKPRLLDPRRAQTALPSIRQTEYLVHALIMLNRLSPDDQRILVSRVEATLHEILSSEHADLERILVATRLLDALGQPLADRATRQAIQGLLVDLQVRESHMSFRVGGFATSRMLETPDPLATARAVELMEIFGVPDEIDTIGLRSYLRPAMHDRALPPQAMVRVATRARFETLPGISPVQWHDYLRYEQNLIMAFLVVVLCLTATLGMKHR